MTDGSQVGVIFWFLSFVILISGFMVVSLKNIFYCALFLVLCLFSVAGIFILLEAEFLAAAQVLIYVGAVAILMIFAIMLTTDMASKEITQTNENVTVGVFVSVIFAISTILLIDKTSVWRYQDHDFSEGVTVTLGKLLMTKFMLPFELVSVLLLAAMIGAIVLARKERS
ncbi:MAG: NADH-quinone oxidoreductase subunit J [Candidatus Zixiibacteriota bacterium]|nr:MAG: NADH-quinone oxidoreductase subunit J [candidate division Zixibacteria bacterium]